MIVLLVPVFSNLIYPFVESRFGRFRLLDRMLAGMFFTCVAFASSAIIQTLIDQTQADGVLEYNEVSDVWECPLDREKAKGCVHGAWQIVSYFIITFAEVLFSVSGLNFTYEEVCSGPFNAYFQVGPKMKASAASLWLLMVAIGNLLVVFLSPLVSAIGERNFYIVCIGIIASAMVLYIFIRRVYVYKEDRPVETFGLEVVDLHTETKH